MWRKDDPVLVLKTEDIAQRMEHSKNGIPQSRGIGSDREAQHDSAVPAEVCVVAIVLREERERERERD